MSPAEKEDLLDRQKHFLKLDPAKQERLRELCNKVEADPDADALLQVMHRYYDWLRTTHSDAQLVLAGLSPEKRVAKIKELLKAEEESARKEGIGPGFPPFPWSGRDPRMLKLYSNRGRPPRPSDMADREGVLKWQEKYVNQHSSELLAKISSPNRKELKEQLEQAKATDYLHRYGVAAMVLLRWQLEMADRNAMPPGLTSTELVELRSGLSEPTRTRLENRDPAAQWRFASGLIREFVLRQSAARKATPAWSLVSDEELAGFFDKLSPRQRADLTKLSGDRMAQALLEMYIGSVLGPAPGLPPDFGPGGGNRGGPPGARRGPGFGPFDLSPPGKREKGKEGEGERGRGGDKVKG
jgi:hypothetical protein